MRVMVLLSFISESGICCAGSRRCIRGKREKFLEEGCDMCRRLGRGLVAI